MLWTAGLAFLCAAALWGCSAENEETIPEKPVGTGVTSDVVTDSMKEGAVGKH